MTIRYFKATNGRFTVFRGSTSRVYLSGWIQCDAQRVVNFGFSMKAPPVGMGLPAEEITKAEYEALNARKIERMGGKAAKWAAPRDSWVANS